MLWRCLQRSWRRAGELHAFFPPTVKSWNLLRRLLKSLKGKRNIFSAYFIVSLQFGGVGTAGAGWMERYSSAVQGGGKDCWNVFHRMMCWVTFVSRPETVFSPCYRKRCCTSTCLKECVTSGWTGRERSVVLGTDNKSGATKVEGKKYLKTYPFEICEHGCCLRKECSDDISNAVKLFHLCPQCPQWGLDV